MVNLPLSFPSVAPNAIASYDYLDVANGTGLTDFYLMREGDSSLGYALQAAQTKTFSKEIDMTGVYVYNGDVFHLSGSAPQTFSLGAFNLPRNVKGRALVQGSYELSGGSSQVLIKQVFCLTKNGVEFASGSTQQASATAGSFSSGSIVLPITISAVTHFARDDVLGVKYYVLGKTTGGAGETSGVKTTIGISPLDENGSVLTPSTNPGETTITKISIPFRLDDVA